MFITTVNTQETFFSNFFEVFASEFQEHIVSYVLMHIESITVQVSQYEVINKLFFILSMSINPLETGNC